MQTRENARPASKKNQASGRFHAKVTSTSSSTSTMYTIHMIHTMRAAIANPAKGGVLNSEPDYLAVE